MTVASLLVLLIQQIQVTGLLNRLDVPWPTVWLNFLNGIALTSLHFSAFDSSSSSSSSSSGSAASSTTVTPRMIFIFISICVPLVINVVVLILFKPATVVLWYAALTGGFFLLVAGLFAQFLPGTVSSTSSMTPMQLIIVGSAAFGVAVVAALVACIIGSPIDKEATYVKERIDSTKFHRKRSLLHLGVFLVCLIGGLLFLRIVTINTPDGSSSDWFSGALFDILGFGMMGAAGIASIFLVLTLFEQGRLFIEDATVFATNHLLLLVLFAVSSSYIAVISYAVDIYLCHTYVCPVGYSFNPYASRPTNSYDTSSTLFCDACTFMEPTCGSAAPPNFVWCPGFADNRWWMHPETTCSDESTIYFFISAAIVLVTYNIGIPVLWFTVIRYLTKRIEQQAAINKTIKGEKDQWFAKIIAVDPVASSLYAPYLVSRRYFVLFFLLYRLVLTLTMTLAAPYSSAASVLFLIFQGLSLLFLILSWPFFFPIENIFAIVLTACGVINGLFAVIVWGVGTSVPWYAGDVFVLFDVILFIVTIPLMVMSYDKENKTREEIQQVSKSEPEEDAKARAEVNKTKTYLLNTTSIHIINKAFMGFGLFLVVALGISFLGLLRATPQTYLNGGDTGSDGLSPAVVFASYNSWSNFTSHCCCLQQQTPNPTYSMAERWVCANGITLDRGRVTIGGANSGLYVRDLCSSTFNQGCSAAPDPTSGNVVLTCPDEGAIVPSHMTAFAYQYLW